jgi:hypothetical protein
MSAEVVLGLIFVILIFAFVAGFFLFPELFGISKEKGDDN